MLLEKFEENNKEKIKGMEKIILENIGKKILTEIQLFSFEAALEEAEFRGIKRKEDIGRFAFEYREFMISYSIEVINCYKRKGKFLKEINFERLMGEAKKIYIEERVNQMHGF